MCVYTRARRRQFLDLYISISESGGCGFDLAHLPLEDWCAWCHGHVCDIKEADGLKLFLTKFQESLLGIFLFGGHTLKI